MVIFFVYCGNSCSYHYHLIHGIIFVFVVICSSYKFILFFYVVHFIIRIILLAKTYEYFKYIVALISCCGTHGKNKLHHFYVLVPCHLKNEKLMIRGERMR